MRHNSLASGCFSGWAWWCNKSIVTDNLGVSSSRFFGSTRTVWVTEIYMMKAKLLVVSSIPLEVVGEGPRGVTHHVDIVSLIC